MLQAGWKETVRSAISIAPPDESSPSDFAGYAAILTGLLVLVVPAVALLTGVSTLILVPLAVSVYVGYATLDGRQFVGMASAFLVLLTFNANVPLLAADGVAGLDIYLADLVLVPLTVVLLYWRSPETTLRESPWALAIVLGLVGLVVWSLLSVAIGNGSSRLAGVFFAVEWVRYVLVLVASAMLVMATSIRSALYPLLVALSGHLMFAIAQVVNGTIFGLSYLGETSPQVIREVTIGPLVLEAGQYAGGFSGTTRILLGLLLLLLPALLVLWSRVHLAVAAAGGTSAILIAVIADSDAGFGALVLTLAGFAVLLGSLSRREKTVRITDTGPAYAATGMFAVILLYKNVVEFGVSTLGGLFKSAPPSGATTSDIPASPTTDTATPTDSKTGNPSTPVDSATPTPATSSSPTPTPVETKTLTSPTTTAPSTPSVVDTSTLGIRIQQYVAAIDVGVSHPLFGLGGYNFYMAATSYGLPRQIVIHNTFLALLAYTGIPGLLSYLISVLAMFVVLLRRSLVGDAATAQLAVALCCGLVGFHAYSFWTNIHTSVVAMGVFWAIGGLAVGASLKS